MWDISNADALFRALLRYVNRPTWVLAQLSASDETRHCLACSACVPAPSAQKLYEMTAWTLAFLTEKTAPTPTIADAAIPDSTRLRVQAACCRLVGRLAATADALSSPDSPLRAEEALDMLAAEKGRCYSRAAFELFGGHLPNQMVSDADSYCALRHAAHTAASSAHALLRSSRGTFLALLVSDQELLAVAAGGLAQSTAHVGVCRLLSGSFSLSLPPPSGAEWHQPVLLRLLLLALQLLDRRPPTQAEKIARLLSVLFVADTRTEKPGARTADCSAQDDFLSRFLSPLEGDTQLAREWLGRSQFTCRQCGSRNARFAPSAADKTPLYCSKHRSEAGSCSVVHSGRIRTSEMPTRQRGPLA